MTERAGAGYLVIEEEAATLDQLRAEGDADEVAEFKLVARPAAQRAHEGGQRVQFVRGGKAEIAPLDTGNGLRQMLAHGTGGEGPKVAGFRSAVARPAGGVQEIAAGAGQGESAFEMVEGTRQTQEMGDRARHARPVEAVGVDSDERQLAQQFRPLEEGRRQQRIRLRQFGDVGGIDRVVVLGRMAGAAGAAVPVERLLEEEPAAFGDQGVVRRRDPERRCENDGDESADEETGCGHGA